MRATVSRTSRKLESAADCLLQVNPELGFGGTFLPSTVNNPDVVRALFGSYSFDDTVTLAVVDAVFSGETPLELKGGKVAWPPACSTAMTASSASSTTTPTRL